MSQFSLDSLEIESQPETLHLLKKDAIPNETAAAKRNRSAPENAIIAKMSEKQFRSLSPTSSPGKENFDSTPLCRKGSLTKKEIPSAEALPEFRHAETKAADLATGSPRIPNNPDAVAKSEKHDKKLGNVLPPANDRRKKRPASYMELYRQRRNVDKSQPRVRSPESSTMSICGDYSPERQNAVFSELDSPREYCCQSSIPGDDQSELSFYRRLMEQRPPESVGDEDTWENDGKGRHSRSRVRGFSNSGGKLRSVSQYQLPVLKEIYPAYRPYTINDYRNLTVPRGDRSLGPDKVEMRNKSECLTRRRSYGDAVSALNRQKIIHQTERIKKRRASIQSRLSDATQRQPSEDATSKIVTDATTKSEKEGSTLVDSNPKETTRKKRLSTATSSIKSSGVRKSKSVQRESHVSQAQSNASRVSKGAARKVSYLQELQDRHLNEKRMIDHLISCTILA